jgi:hypothetical protein
VTLAGRYGASRKPEDVGLSRSLPSTTTDILQPGGEIRRERVKGYLDVPLEVHH